MKVQINSREALERLIANDKELELAIKNTILNEIAGKYLKSIANSKIMETVKIEINNEMRKGTLRKMVGIIIFPQRQKIKSH